MGLLLADLLWFASFLYLIVPDVTSHFPEYLLFFALWGLVGFSLGFVSRKQAAIVLVFFLFAVVTSYSVGRGNSEAWRFAFAFPGAYNGSGLVAALVLFKRHVLRTAKTRWIPSSGAWKTKRSRDAILTCAFVYPALFVFTLYFTKGEPVALEYLGSGLIAVAMFFAVRPKRPLRRG